MKKTTLYLEVEIDHALGRLARERGVTKAELIRSTLREAARRVERPRITAIGLARGPGDVANDVDRHLAETEFGR